MYGDELDTSLIAASGGAIIVGPTTPTDDTYYSGVAGPITFGAGGEFLADSGGGGIVGLGTFDEPSGGVVAVPQGYVSGAPLGTSTATFTNATISGLGLTPGAYVWTWGDGATADSFTLDISSVGAAARGARTRHLGDDGPGPCGAGAFANAPPYSGFQGEPAGLRRPRHSP